MDRLAQRRILWMHFIFAFLGTLITLALCVLGDAPVLASSLVGILLSTAAITLRLKHHYSWAGFSGSFAGMTALPLLGWMGDWTSPEFLVSLGGLSLLTALLFAASEPLTRKNPRFLFDGFGGRLGTLAFLAVVIFISAREVLTGGAFTWLFAPTALQIGPDLLFLTMAGGLGAVVSMAVKDAFGESGGDHKVLAVSIAGLIGALILVKIPLWGNSLSLAWYAGAFVGMSSSAILTRKRTFFASGLTAGLLTALMAPFFNGVGGKLGLTAFLAVVLTRLIHHFLRRIF